MMTWPLALQLIFLVAFVASFTGAILAVVFGVLLPTRWAIITCVVIVVLAVAAIFATTYLGGLIR